MKAFRSSVLATPKPPRRFSTRIDYTVVLEISLSAVRWVGREGRSRFYWARGRAMNKFLSPYRSPHSQKFADRSVTKPPLREAAEASAQVKADKAVTPIEQPAVKVRRAKKAARVNNGSSVTNYFSVRNTRD